MGSGDDDRTSFPRQPDRDCGPQWFAASRCHRKCGALDPLGENPWAFGWDVKEVEGRSDIHSEREFARSLDPLL